MIEIGEQAPDFSLRAGRSRRLQLSRLLGEGKTVVLVFYLLDFSPKWSGELSQFEAKYEEFRRMGAEIVGISVDSHFTHTAYSKKLGLEFPLVSDFNREIVGTYVGFYDDVDGMKGVNRRAIVVVDPGGRVRWTWSTDDPGEVPDTEAVREAVQEIFHGDWGGYTGRPRA